MTTFCLRVCGVMADYVLGGLGELEDAKDDLWDQSIPTLDPWKGEEDETFSRNRVGEGEESRTSSHSRLSPLPPPISRHRLSSPLEEEDNNDVEDERRESLSPPPRSDSPIDHMMYSPHVSEPIRLRGVGGTTLFGLNSKFDDDFPSYLVGKVAPEEFQATMARINSVLYKSIPFNLKCLVCGCLCCCCTLGMSLGPVLYLSKRTQTRLAKIIAQENWRLYNKLGLNIKLHKEQCDGANLREYVLHVEFLPKQPLYHPE